MLRMEHKAPAILSSLHKNWVWVASFSVPRAKPRMTIVHTICQPSRHDQGCRCGSSKLTSNTSLIPSVASGTDQHGQKVDNDGVVLEERFVAAENET